jgi:hypothetical protein
MVERQDPHYEDTEAPRNPPNAVTNRDARRQALWSYLGPIIILFVIIGIAMIYWARREPGRTNDDRTLNPAIGTTGERLGDENQSGYPQDGGDPNRRPANTADELKYRGANR